MINNTIFVYYYYYYYSSEDLIVTLCQFNTNGTTDIKTKPFPDNVKQEGTNLLLPVAETNVTTTNPPLHYNFIIFFHYYYSLDRIVLRPSLVEYCVYGVVVIYHVYQ